MTKRQLIDQIIQINRSADPSFLAQFDPDDLSDYLQHLRLAQTPRPVCFHGDHASAESMPKAPADMTDDTPTDQHTSDQPILPDLLDDKQITEVFATPHNQAEPHQP